MIHTLSLIGILAVIGLAFWGRYQDWRNGQSVADHLAVTVPPFTKPRIFRLNPETVTSSTIVETPPSSDVATTASTFGATGNAGENVTAVAPLEYMDPYAASVSSVSVPPCEPHPAHVTFVSVPP